MARRSVTFLLAFLAEEVVDVPAVLGVGGEPAVGKQFVELIVRQRRQPGEQVPQISPRLDSARFAAGDEAEQDRRTTSAGPAGDEQTVLAADRGDLHRPFRDVVVDGQLAVLAVPQPYNFRSSWAS